MEKHTGFTQDFKEQKHDAYKCKTKGWSESIKGTDNTSMTRKWIFSVPVVSRKQTKSYIEVNVVSALQGEKNYQVKDIWSYRT